MSTAYLGLGGNLGDRCDCLRRAVLALNSEDGVRVDKLSSVYETLPVGVVDQPDFLNMVVEVATALSARELLQRCLKIEAALGRVRAERWGPRIIDIDILWFGGLSLREPGLELPHPRLMERAFVLAPLAEIAPALAIGDVPIQQLVDKIGLAGLRRLGPLDTLPS